ncbi:MAG: hypothetical protein Kow00127_13240 [Bacteroidales bacterium]
MLEWFRKIWGNWQLSRKAGKVERRKRWNGLENATSIAIIYQVTGKDLFDAVKELSKRLVGKGKEVVVIGYVESDEIPDYCVAANVGYYFTGNDLNWYGAPKSDYLHSFIRKPFDLLIDLSVEERYITRYLTTLSPSSLKVGPDLPHTQPVLDMMIRLEKPGRPEIYILEILKYLSMIKPA